MTLAEELEAIEARGKSKAVVVDCAELARRALATDDLPLAVAAKQHEAQTARMLGMHQHTVVVCAEVVELWAKLAGQELASKTRTSLVWTLKHGAGSAMDLPEIPFSTVRELIGQLDEILASWDGKRIAVWELEARLAYLEGDPATVRERVAKIGPTVSISSHLWDYADCPGCMIMQAVEYLGPEAPIEELEAATAPLTSKQPFPADASRITVLRMFYGDDNMCENARRSLPVRMARGYARARQLAKARREAQRGLEVAGVAEPERRLRALTTSLYVALALVRPDREELASRFAEVMAAMPGIEDPYELLDATKIAHRAAVTLGKAGDADKLAEQALALARRVDRRLAAPRHERETRAALGVR